MIIGITGGSGAGKTTLLDAVRAHGGFVIDCDALYHGLLRENSQLVSEILAAFPTASIDGTLDRKELGKIVFSDPEKMQMLNSISWRYVREEVEHLLESANCSLIAIDAIGLIECGASSLCDVTVAVDAPAELRIARIMQRDGISEEYAKKRIDSQHSAEWFAEHCDYVLKNYDSESDFAETCNSFICELLKSPKST